MCLEGAALTSGIPVDLEGGDVKRKRGKDGVRSALQMAQHSTASMGRFDEQRMGEPVRKLKGQKRMFRDNLGSLSNEKAIMSAQLRIVSDKIDKKKRGVSNSLAPYEGIIPDAPSDSFKQRKGKGKVRSAASLGSVDGSVKKKRKVTK